MAPRGLKKFVTDSAPGKLRGKRGFCAVDADGKYTGSMLRGVTKRLTERLYSRGELDTAALESTEWMPTAWRGNSGGLRRGKAVDSQVSRLASASETARKNAGKFKFTSHCFSALAMAGLEPLMGQRVVLNKTLRIATAADVVCFRKSDNALVIVELKCGFSGSRTLPAALQRKPQALNAPMATASDCILHRHLAQLTATWSLLANEAGFVKGLKDFGVTKLAGALLYVCDRDTELHELGVWWQRRGRALCTLLGQS